MRMLVDSNVIIESGFRLGSQACRILLDSKDRLGIEIVVPELVIMECVQKYKEELTESKRGFENWAKNHQRIIGAKPEIPPELHDIDLTVDGYEHELRSLLDERGVAIAPIPEIAHHTLAARAVCKERPFSREKEGYRDALIWQSVVEQAEETDSDVIFLTSNVTDFADKRDDQFVIHPDLQKYIKNGKQVELVRSVTKLNQDYVIPTLEDLSSIAKRLRQGELEELDLVAFLSARLGGMLKSVDEWISSEVAGIESDADYLRFDSVSGNIEVESTDVRKLDDNTLLVDVELIAECEFEMGAHIMSDAASRFDFYFDNETSTIHGWINKDLSVDVQLLVDSRNYEVHSAEIKRIGRDGVIRVWTGPEPSKAFDGARTYWTRAIELD